MSLAHLNGIRHLVICFFLALASGGVSVAAPGPSGQQGRPDESVTLPVVLPPVKTAKPQPTEQELQARAEKGDVDAIKAYADFLQSPKDFPWYLKAAEGGNIESMVIVASRANDAKMNPSGKNQALSDEWSNKVLQLAKQALSDKDPKVLGIILSSDYDNHFDDPTRAQYALTAGRAGGFEIENANMAVIDAFPAGPERAQLLQKCSENGHLQCTFALAMDYLDGSDGLTTDHAHAFDLFRRSATYQNWYAPYNDPGLSPLERVQFIKWSIENGNIDSVVDLSLAYWWGYGVPKSERIATALLQAAIKRPDYWNKGRALGTLEEMQLADKYLLVDKPLFLKAFNSASSLHERERGQLAGYAYSWASKTFGYNIFGWDRGPSPDVPTALMVLKTLAENGPPFNGAVSKYHSYNASLLLGEIYYAGKLVKQSYVDAMTWFQQAEVILNNPARDGGRFNNNGDVENRIANLYFSGLGVPKDIKSAMSWYQKSVDHKNTWGEYNLAEALMSGTPAKEDIDRAISLYRASAEAGNGAAQNKLGALVDTGKYLPQNYKEANDWYEKGIKSGNARSMLNLAFNYQEGHGVDRDLPKAVDLYQRAVNGGDISATIYAAKRLANIYLVGDGIPKDVTKVFALYKKAADAGDAESEVAVGALYQMGQGVNRDLSETFGWFQKAAAQNYAASAARAELTRLYHDAGGAAEDFSMAASLYEKVSSRQH